MRNTWMDDLEHVQDLCENKQKVLPIGVTNELNQSRVKIY